MSLFFILDVVNFYTDQTQGLNSSNSISYYGKGIVEVILILILLIRGWGRSFLLMILCFSIIPIIAYGLSIYSTSATISYNHLFQLFKEGNKYIFPMLLFVGIQSFKFRWGDIKVIFESIFILSAVIVIVAFAFDLSYFYTYDGNRFGFKPPFSTQNEITFFWMIGVTYFGSVMLKEKSIKYTVSLILLLFASLILGTKAIALYLFCYSLFMFFSIKRISINQKILGIVLTIIAFCIFAYVSGIFSFFYVRYLDQGLLYAITSKRNLLFEQSVIPLLAQWKWYNIFIGGTYVDMPVSEMGLVDLYLFSGLIGFGLFFILLRQTIFAFTRKNAIGLFFVSQYILIGSLAGHIFSSGINAIYLAVLCYYLQQSNLGHSPVKVLKK
ncbi:hypothetical protein [Saccharicrinis carchari]|nr:hypothetical protein [Saccharicrinis carchari]